MTISISDRLISDELQQLISFQKRVSDSKKQPKRGTNQVKHEYIDASTLSPEDVERILAQRIAAESNSGKVSSKKNGVTNNFAMKLHQLLDYIDEGSSNRLHEIISWQPHGRSFKILDQERFVKIILKRYYRQTKFTSFQRQLHLYGFLRLTRGVDAGAYYHSKFLRGRPHLVKLMIRTKIKGSGIKSSSNPDAEPHFYSMPPLCNKLDDSNNAGEIQLQGVPQQRSILSLSYSPTLIPGHLTKLADIKSNHHSNPYVCDIREVRDLEMKTNRNPLPQLQNSFDGHERAQENKHELILTTQSYFNASDKSNCSCSSIVSEDESFAEMFTNSLMTDSDQEVENQCQEVYEKYPIPNYLICKNINYHDTCKSFCSCSCHNGKEYCDRPCFCPLPIDFSFSDEKLHDVKPFMDEIF